MEKVNIDKNIVLVKNIVTPEESSFLINMIENATEQEWAGYKNNVDSNGIEINAAYGNWKTQMLNLEFAPNLLERARVLLDDIQERCNREIKENYGKDYVVDNLYSIYRFQEGDMMHEHHDSGLSPKIKNGVVIYLNDDFEGGEIYYPKVKIEIKPVANALLIHPANMIYRHGVKPVTNGSRYSLAGFARIL
jgi:hypothetical protein